MDAILIGVAITTASYLGGWGIVSARGNPVESSLLVSSGLLILLVLANSQSSPMSLSASTKSLPTTNHLQAP